MTGEQMFSQTHGKQAAQLRACFPGLTERDLVQMLCSTPIQAVFILQQSFGCDLEDAKAAWNEYVLRYVDGPQSISPVDAGYVTHRQAGRTDANLFAH